MQAALEIGIPLLCTRHCWFPPSFHLEDQSDCNVSNGLLSGQPSDVDSEKPRQLAGMYCRETRPLGTNRHYL